MFTIAAMHMRQILLGSRRWLLTLGLIAPVFLCTAIAFGGELNNETEKLIVPALVLFACYTIAAPALAALLYGTSVLGDEIQDKTLTYLFTRPTPRWQILSGKYLANVGFLSAATIASLLIASLVLQPRSGILLGLVVSTAVATAAYNAVFMFLGAVWTKRTLIAGVFYLAVFELIPGFMPANVRELTITYHTRCLVLNLSGITDDIPVEAEPFIAAIGDASTEQSLLVPAIVILVMLLLTTRVASRREFALTDEP